MSLGRWMRFALPLFAVPLLTVAGCAQPGAAGVEPTGTRAIPDGFLLAPDAGRAPPFDGSIERPAPADAGPAEMDGGSTDRCASALASYRFDFESGAQGFTHQALDGFASDRSWPFDGWQQGDATSGPGRCHGGSGCYATSLDGNYTQCQRAELVSPTIDLSACGNGARLVFYQYYDFWSGRYDGQSWADGGTVELSGDGGATWVAADAPYPGAIAINPSQGSSYSCLQGDSFYVNGLAGYTGQSQGWQKVVVPIPADLATAELQVRFIYGSGVSYPTTDPSVSESHEPPGWYLDDLSFEVP